MVNEAGVANMADSFLEANEEANEDSIALSGGKFNCCFMITSVNVIAVEKISVVESACEIQSTYATTNQNVDADLQSKDVFNLLLKGKAFFDLLAVDLVSNITFVPTFTDRQESQLLFSSADCCLMTALPSSFLHPVPILPHKIFCTLIFIVA